MTTAEAYKKTVRFVRTRVGRVMVGLFIATALVAGQRLLLPRLTGPFVMTVPGQPGWNAYVDSRNGWTLQFPNGWHAQGIDEQHRGGPYTSFSQGVLLSNINHHYKHPPAERNSYTPYFDMSGLPATLVALRVSLSYGGGFVLTRCTDTPLPLSLEDAQRTVTKTGAHGTTQTHLYSGFTLRGISLYHIDATIGSAATSTDRALLKRIVASIYYATTPKPTLAPGTTCTDVG